MIRDARCNFGINILLIHHVSILDSPTITLAITTGLATITTSNEDSYPSPGTGYEIC